MWTLALVGLLVGCSGDAATGTIALGTPLPVTVTSFAAEPSTTMSRVTATATGVGVLLPLVFSLESPGATGASSGSLTIPTGPAGIFTARA